MRRLTVLLDPGRLKRWVGPNVELGPPLKAGQMYTLEIGPGMMDLNGRPLLQRFRKRFFAGDSVRGHVSVESWELRPPVTGSRQPLVLLFRSPLDWALLQHTITVRSPEGSLMTGEVVVGECETRWSFIPASSWIAGKYRLDVGSGLEDVCGNSTTGAFDRPIREVLNPEPPANAAALFFRLT